MIEEKIFIGDDYPLQGVLTLPSTQKTSYPLVILIPSPGKIDRDYTTKNSKVYQDLTVQLANLGIATYRYDSRTFVHHRQLIKDFKRDFTVNEEIIADVLHATDKLKLEKKIDIKNIFLLGHHLGGGMLPRAATLNDSYRGLIILSPTEKKQEDIMKEKQQALLDKSKGLIKQLMKKQIMKVQQNLDYLYQFTDDEAQLYPLTPGKTYYYLKEAGLFSFKELIPKVEIPTLLIHGKQSPVVSASEMINIKNTVKENVNITIKEYDGLDDLLLKTGENNKFSETVAKDIAEWVLKR